MEKLLLVEDDLALGQGVRLALQTEDRPVTLCRTLAQARQALEGEGPFALALLDVNLPDGSGLTFLEEVRGRLPVILLTANDWETDIVAGLELGAEDYITKPFSLAVLRARVNAQLRRSSGESSTVVQVGPFTFDFGRMEYRTPGGPEQDRAETSAPAGPEPGNHPHPGRPGGPDLDRRGGVRGRECPLRHRQTPAGQVGGHPLQAPVP